LRFLIAALILCAVAPAAAQPAATDRSTYPAELLAPNQDSRAFFEVVALRPLTDELLATAVAAMPDGASRGMDDVIEGSLARGELVPNWRSTGLDLADVVGSRAGGAAGNVLVRTGEFGSDVTYFDDAPLDRFIPPNLVLVARRGEPVNGEIVQVEVGHLSPKVVFAERVAYRREGNAYCRAGADTRLYAVPEVPASQLDVFAVVIAMRSLPVLERMGICEVIEARGSDGYVTRSFDQQGHRFTAMDDAAETFQIVPRTPSGDQSQRR
jgi:hypothetical protein